MSKVNITLFHADWCHYCKILLPEWEKLEGLLVDNKKFSINKYEESANPEKFIEENIHGFPTIKIYKNDKFIENYKGERKAEAMYDYLKTIAEQKGGKKKKSKKSKLNRNKSKKSKKSKKLKKSKKN